MANQDNMDEDLISLIHESFPSKTLVEISDYENEEHQSYKFLFENLNEDYQKLEEQIADLKTRLQCQEREIEDAAQELKTLQDLRNGLNGTAEKVVAFLDLFLNQGITISNLQVYGENKKEIVTQSDLRQHKVSVAERPAIYDFKRPSWFTPLHEELSRQNIFQSNTRLFERVVREKKLFWEKIVHNRKNGISTEKLKEKVDVHRKEQIEALLQDKSCTNAEKYLKYILLTPGMPKDYFKTLSGASDLGLDADCVIELLEQPKEFFNKEIVETFVSEAHKATEYNLKRELANELLQGKWYISAEVNGQLQNFELVPYEWLEEIYKKLTDIYATLKTT